MEHPSANVTRIAHAIGRLDLVATHDALKQEVLHQEEAEVAGEAASYASGHKRAAVAEADLDAKVGRASLKGKPGDVRRSTRDGSPHESALRPLGLPSYAICVADLWGLTAFDYGLLALFAYFDTDTAHLNKALAGLFPPTTCEGEGTRDEWEPGCVDTAAPRVVPHETSSADVSADGTVFWTEVEFPHRNLTVIAVRGTEFWRMSDWLEDVRMWTEPVVFSLLSLVFPSIHVMPHPGHCGATCILAHKLPPKNVVL